MVFKPLKGSHWQMDKKNTPNSIPKNQNIKQRLSKIMFMRKQIIKIWNRFQRLYLREKRKRFETERR